MGSGAMRWTPAACMPRLLQEAFTLGGMVYHSATLLDTLHRLSVVE